MILAIDVHYYTNHTSTAGVFFKNWGAREPFSTDINITKRAKAYEPGAFYRRELPPILEFLSKVKIQPNTIIIDSYIHLIPPRKGLGIHLYEARQIPVIGVAKNPLKIACEYQTLFRGRSNRSLYVSSVGMELEQAVVLIGSMHGQYRIPTLLKLADTLCREGIYSYSH